MIMGNNDFGAIFGVIGGKITSIKHCMYSTS